MGLVPKLQTSCFCCTMKTGSFVTAWFLLVGSSVQTGYYAFLVDHVKPQEMYTAVQYVLVKDKTPVYRDYDYYDYDLYYPRGGYYDELYHHPKKNELPNKPGETNTTDGKPPNSNSTTQGATNTTGGERSNSSKATNTTQATGGRTAPRRPHYRNPWRHRAWFLWNFRRRLEPRYEERTYKKPCVRDYRPFDADSGFLDFDTRAPFNKSILYVNIILWVTMMALTVLLMVGVYKESEGMVTAWLLAEAFLLTLATASTVVTSALMIRGGALPVQIGIVTLLNMAIHLAINIYFMIVVFNYRQELAAKEEDDTEAEQIVV